VIDPARKSSSSEICLQDCGPLLFQIGNMGCLVSTERITYAHQSASKKETYRFLNFMSRMSRA
jgi:hypothetical protein